jgi:hypothetical protein
MALVTFFSTTSHASGSQMRKKQLENTRMLAQGMEDGRLPTVPMLKTCVFEIKDTPANDIGIKRQARTIN